ncbi:unnamed protein product, partial [Dovyalis caffra]
MRAIIDVKDDILTFKIEEEELTEEVFSVSTLVELLKNCLKHGETSRNEVLSVLVIKNTMVVGGRLPGSKGIMFEKLSKGNLLLLSSHIQVPE